MRRSVLRRATAYLLVATGVVCSVLAQECPGTVGSPHLTDRSLDEAYSSCTSVEGDIIIGVADCSLQCNITSLTSLARLRTISGSLTIQCCNLLEEINGLNSLTSLTGTLRIYYNQQLHTINGFEVLRNSGNVEISQNINLTSIVGLSALQEIEGHLEIGQNPRLLELDGLSSLKNIRGSDLISGHALSIIYNTALLDLSWLRNLTQIDFGTVHIEGNLKLCYAGYPQWSVGEYNARPPAGDKGIDWRTVLSPGVPVWQYTWGVENGGYPTLVIQNNAAYDDCEGALCHESCVNGAGCLGPMDPSLCGTCFEGVCEIRAMPTSLSCDPTPIPYWPPVEMPYSLLFGILFAFCGILLLCLVLLGVWVMYHVCKRLRAGRKGSFDIQDELEMVGMELRRRDERETVRGDSSSLHHSSIIAQSSQSTETRMNGSHSQRGGGGNVVLTSSSYRSTATSNDDVALKHTSSPTTTTTTHTPSTNITTGTSPHSDTQQSTTNPKLSTASNETATTDTNAAVISTITSPSAVVTATLPGRLSHSELQGSLHSIPEEVEDEADDGEAAVKNVNQESLGDKEQTDLAVRNTPRKRLYKHDTLTRLQKGESVHVQMTFPRSQLKLKKEIGNGDFGTVFFAEAKKLTAGEKKTPVIVKQLKEDSSKQEQENFLRPVEAMSLLQHPNVLSLLGACVDGPPIMILMEYCSHGNLKTYLVRKRRESVMFKESGKMMTAACHMAAGLTYLHSNIIAHNDFAVRSCVVSSNEVVKLGDYGLTKHIFKEDYYSRGSRQKAWPIRWMAPEQMIIKGKTVLDSQPASTTGNVWSFGIALWEIGTLAQWPYFDLSNEEVIDTVLLSWKCGLENPFEASDPLSPLYDIMQSCWMLANERPTMPDVLHQLEDLRDEIARNTPTSSRKRRITRSSPSNSPKTTPTGTPIVPHPKPATRMTQEEGIPPPTTTRSAKQPAEKRHGGKGYAPRRPAPKIPDEGSLKRGTTTKTSQVLNDSQQHPLEKTVKAQTEKKPSEVPQDVHHRSDKGEASGAVTSIRNLVFATMNEDDSVKEVDDVIEGILFVNQAAKENERVSELQKENEAETEPQNAWEEEEEDDFILEPPIDFSQTSMDRDSPSLPLAGLVDPHDLYNPSESQCTSIDDFEQTFELPPSLEPSPEVVQKSIRAQASLDTCGASNTAGLHSSKQRKKKKKRSGASTHDRMNDNDRMPSSYQDQTQVTRDGSSSTTGKVEYARKEMDMEQGWNESDFADDDSRYRRPTSRIKALLKRAPSWGRSGKDDGTREDDTIPNVVYDDEVSALIW